MISFDKCNTPHIALHSTPTNLIEHLADRDFAVRTATINEWLKYIISIGPFGCMPSRVAEAILSEQFTTTEKKE
jgi:hypothetical protein